MALDSLLSRPDLPPDIRHVLDEELAARSQTESDLRASQDELRAILDNAPLMIFVVDRDRKVRKVNQVVEKGSGSGAGELVGRTPGDALRCVHRLDPGGCGLGPECSTCPVRRAISDTLARGRTHRGIEVTLPGDSARDRVLRVSTAPMAAGGARAALVCAEDVTGRRRTEKALRESEAVLRALVESTRSPIAVLDRERRLRAFNSAFSDMMKAAHGVEAHAGLCVTDPLPVEERDWWLERIGRALDGEFIHDEVVKKVGGEARVFGVSLNPVVRRGQVTGVSQFARDITERRQAEQMLRVLSRRLLLAQEEERARISRELHDEVGQVLTAVKIGLQRLERGDGAESMAPRVAGSILAVDRAIQDVRHLCLDLRPPLLDELGLETALRAHAERLAREAGIEIEVRTCDLAGVPMEIEIVCFRVVQEALTNVVRHARAARASVVIGPDRRGLQLVVRDDGSGFDVAAALAQGAAGQRVGLASMRERVGLLGGRLDIESAPGAGTEIRAWLPVEVPRAVPSPPAAETPR
jgi:PAS domain S-box-containing protein